MLPSILFAITTTLTLVLGLPLNHVVERGLITLPIHEKRGSIRQQGLGAFEGVVDYQLSVEIGGQTLWLTFDTGSSDLIVLTKDCQDPLCVEGLAQGDPPYDPALDPSVTDTGSGVRFLYGELRDHHFATGEILRSTAVIAGWKVANVSFAAINSTNVGQIVYSASGTLGASWPSLSQIFDIEFNASHPANSSTPEQLAKDYLASSDSWPLIRRLASQGYLKTPSFSTSLRRLSDPETSNAGVVTLGGLPSHIDACELTYIPLHLPLLAGWSFADQVGPLPVAWTIPVEGMTLNGRPFGNLSSVETSIALLDTGTAGINLPAAEAQAFIQATGLDPEQITVPCSTRIDLSVRIAGKEFLIDPVDWFVPTNDSSICSVTVGVAADPIPGRQYSWILGAVFLKNVVAHFSFDPPQIGLLSTTPSAPSDERFSRLFPNPPSTATFSPSVTVVRAPSGTTSVGDPRFTGWSAV